MIVVRLMKFLVLASPLVGACGYAMAQGAEIPISGIFDLSGPAADVGKNTLAGVQFGIDELNKKGGVLGKKIQFKYLDGSSNPQRAVDQGTILAREGAKFLLAPQSSASTIAASKGVSEKFKLPMCSNSSGSDDITIKSYQPYIFAMSVNSYMEVKAEATRLAKKPYTRLAVLGADYAGPRSATNRFKQFLKVLNPKAEFVAEEYTKFGATDYTPSINKLLAANPDFIYSQLFGSDLITFAKQAEALGFFDSIKGKFTALYDTNTLRAMGEAAPFGSEGYERAPFSEIVKNVPVGKDFVEGFKAATGDYPSDWATQGYECIVAWAQAVTKANSVEADDVMRAIETTRFSLPRGDLIFGKYDHQLEVPTYLGKVVRSKEFGQPLLEITDVVPGVEVRPSKEELDGLRGR